MNNKSHKYLIGFAPILVIIIIATISVIGFIFYQSFKKTEILKPMDIIEIKSGIYGKVFGVSDVETFPIGDREYPLSQVRLITIQKEKYYDWINNLEKIQRSRIIREGSISGNYTFTKPEINGEYLLPLSPDKYAACFTWQGATQGTHIVNQCVEVTILTDQNIKIDYSSGEFGTRISCLENSSCKELEIPLVEDVFRSVTMNKYPYPSYKRSETISINPNSINFGVGSESDHKTYSNAGFEELSNYIKDSGFLSLQENYESSSNQSDLYLITIYYEDKREKAVKCYLDICPQGFKSVLDRVTSLWYN